MPSYTVVYEGKGQEAAYRRLFKKYKVKPKKVLHEAIGEPLTCLMVEYSPKAMDSYIEMIDEAMELRSRSKLFK